MTTGFGYTASTWRMSEFSFLVYSRQANPSNSESLNSIHLPPTGGWFICSLPVHQVTRYYNSVVQSLNSEVTGKPTTMVDRHFWGVNSRCGDGGCVDAVFLRVMAVAVRGALEWSQCRAGCSAKDDWRLWSINWLRLSPILSNSKNIINRGKFMPRYVLFSRYLSAGSTNGVLSTCFVHELIPFCYMAPSALPLK